MGKVKEDVIMALAVWAAMAAGNFVYQWLTECDWQRAFERSYFQGIAVGVMAVVSFTWGKKK